MDTPHTIYLRTSHLLLRNFSQSPSRTSHPVPPLLQTHTLHHNVILPKVRAPLLAQHPYVTTHPLSTPNLTIPSRPRRIHPPRPRSNPHPLHRRRQRLPLRHRHHPLPKIPLRHPRPLRKPPLLRAPRPPHPRRREKRSTPRNQPDPRHPVLPRRQTRSSGRRPGGEGVDTRASVDGVGSE